MQCRSLFDFTGIIATPWEHLLSTFHCGARATVLQEVEDQDDGQFDDVQKKSHKIKQVAQTQNSELTSWETYNYILYGYVNELVQLGCKEELILTTLQLWTAYLRKNEVAFFGKKDTNLPKFAFKHKQRDVRLIYSVPIKRRRTSSKASSEASGGTFTYRQSKIALRKKKQSVATTQYEEYMSSQKTDISSVGLNLSRGSSTGQSTDNSETTIRIKYSRRARRKVKGKISREHVIAHQNDIGRKLKCHDYKDKEVLGRSFVFALLWLALNQIGDSLQISDLIRYAKEAHIKLNNISSFLPPNINGKQAVNHFRKSSNDTLTHASLRTKALTIARIIGIRNVEQPDLAMLCERYCKDLNFPMEISEMAKRLIVFHPPQMKTSESSLLSRTVPNFEGRAMAYIIFILKLFFGLDDKREKEISRSAQIINDKLVENDSKQASLFVWTEWAEYIEMRNTILSQCHYPTAMQIDPNTTMHTAMYIDFLKRNNEDSAYQENYRKVEMDNIRLIFDQIVQLHEQHEKPIEMPSCHFQPSLTPFSSYIEQIIGDRSIKSKIYIPDYMSVNHEKRDIISYLKPKILRKELRTMNIQLKTNFIGFNRDLAFQNVHVENTKCTANVKLEFDVTRAEWIDLLKERDDKQKQQLAKTQIQNNGEIKQEVDEHLLSLKVKQAAHDLHRKAQRSNENTSSNDNNEMRTSAVAESQSIMTAQQYFDVEEKETIDDILLTEPRRYLDKQPNMLDYQSSDDESNETDDHDPNAEYINTIEFVISNFDYWISMQNIYYITNASFADSVNALPNAFQWLLKQCALQIHQHIKDVYIELLAIENQYRYILKPIFKMDSYIKYRSNTTNKFDKNTQTAIRHLKRIW